MLQLSVSSQEVFELSDLRLQGIIPLSVPTDFTEVNVQREEVDAVPEQSLLKQEVAHHSYHPKQFVSFFTIKRFD